MTSPVNQNQEKEFIAARCRELRIPSNHSNSPRLKVLVLCGGPGPEREVSLASGRAIIKALTLRGHQVVSADISPDDLSALDQDNIDVVFPILHGTFGEDGQLQEIMEKKRICFVGSDSASSRLAMDKFRSKQVFLREGLATPASELIGAVGPKAQLDKNIQDSLTRISPPWVIKPNSQGSSLGITIVHDQHSAEEAIKLCLRQYNDCLVEQFIDGHEFTVGVLGSTPLPVLEVQVEQGFYDYRAKYIDEDTGYIFDLDLPDKNIRQMQDISLQAFNCLGCRDLARVDFIRDGRGCLYVLEVNTLPGFTDHSLVPKAAARAGMSMGQICDMIVQMAYKRSINNKL